MFAIEAKIETAFASKYLQQLCKHFAHKVPSVFDTQKGSIRFAFGDCALKAEENGLEIHCQCAAKDDLDRAKFVIGDHLERFAWKEKLSIQWQEATLRPTDTAA